jgi:hypothetical protein
MRQIGQNIRAHAQGGGGAVRVGRLVDSVQGRRKPRSYVSRVWISLGRARRWSCDEMVQ